MMPYSGPISAVAYLQLSQDNDTHAARAAADALRAVTCDPNWPRGYCTLGDALLRLGSPLERLKRFSTARASRGTRAAWRTRSSWTGRGGTRATRLACGVLVFHAVLSMALTSATDSTTGPEGDGAFERAAQERYCPEGARPDEERHV